MTNLTLLSLLAWLSIYILYLNANKKYKKRGRVTPPSDYKINNELNVTVKSDVYFSFYPYDHHRHHRQHRRRRHRHRRHHDHHRRHHHYRLRQL